MKMYLHQARKICTYKSHFKINALNVLGPVKELIPIKL